MVTKTKKSTAAKGALPLSSSVKDSAQLIWQAGLGAFNKAQAEGAKAFEALVKEGVSFQRKTQLATEEKMTEASSNLSAMTGGTSAKAPGQWDKLETVFEERVAKALSKLGVPSAPDLNALTRRLDELTERVQKLSAKAAPAAAKKATRSAAKLAVKSAAKLAAKSATESAVKPTTKLATKAAAKRAAPRKTTPT